MTAALIHLADEFLISFMLVLAVVPVALVWQDGRRRSREASRLDTLRREAGLAERLRARQEGAEMPSPTASLWVGPRA
jgi:hypothetical protein